MGIEGTLHTTTAWSHGKANGHAMVKNRKRTVRARDLR
jgi:hypothetical protein